MRCESDRYIYIYTCIHIVRTCFSEWGPTGYTLLNKSNRFVSDRDSIHVYVLAHHQWSTRWSDIGQYRNDSVVVSVQDYYILRCSCPCIIKTRPCRQYACWLRAGDVLDQILVTIVTSVLSRRETITYFNNHVGVVYKQWQWRHAYICYMLYIVVYRIYFDDGVNILEKTC
jgi:hypothetical protein